MNTTTPTPRLVPDRPSDAAILSPEESIAVDAVLANAEHDAGDTDDLPPNIDDDEDAYWAWHTFHAITKLRKIAAAPRAEAPADPKSALVRKAIGQLRAMGEWDGKTFDEDLHATLRELTALDTDVAAEAPAELGDSPSLNENAAPAWAVDWELRALDVPLSVGRTERTPGVHPSLPAHYQTRLQFGAAENPGNTVAFVFGNSSTENESRAMAEKLVAAYNAITPRQAAAPAAPAPDTAGEELTDYLGAALQLESLLLDQTSNYAERAIKHAAVALRIAHDKRSAVHSELPDDVMRALDRMCTPVEGSWLPRATAEADARSMKIIRDYILSAPRVTGGREVADE